MDLSTSEGKERIRQIMQAEVNAYDAYLRGEIYEYTIENEDTGEILDSCTGYFCEEDCEQDAEYALQYARNSYIQENADFMHNMIQNV